jgi:zinc transport system substrate-binding protein
MNSRHLAAVALAIASTALAACEQATAPAPPPPARPLVVASFYALYDFAQNVAGDRAEVVALVPPGVEPHDWEPAPRDVAQLQKAKVFIFNGAGFEPWVDKLDADVRAGGALVVTATEGLPLRKAARAGHGHDRDHGHRHGQSQAGEALDPHAWLDPVLAKTQVERIREGLAQADPANAAAYDEAARAYAARLDALHEAFQDGLRNCARRDVVVSHAAFAYLTARYGLSMVPVMGVSPESEPSPAELAALVRVAKRRKVKYIFFETLVNARLADTLAREVGAQTLVLNPVEGLAKDEAEAGKNYLSLMEENLKNLRTALECQ